MHCGNYHHIHSQRHHLAKTDCLIFFLNYFFFLNHIIDNFLLSWCNRDVFSSFLRTADAPPPIFFLLLPHTFPLVLFCNTYTCQLEGCVRKCFCRPLFIYSLIGFFLFVSLYSPSPSLLFFFPLSLYPAFICTVSAPLTACYVIVRWWAGPLKGLKARLS